MATAEQNQWVKSVFGVDMAAVTAGKGSAPAAGLERALKGGQAGGAGATGQIAVDWDRVVADFQSPAPAFSYVPGDVGSELAALRRDCSSRTISPQRGYVLTVQHLSALRQRGLTPKAEQDLAKWLNEHGNFGSYQVLDVGQTAAATANEFDLMRVSAVEAPRSPGAAAPPPANPGSPALPAKPAGDGGGLLEGKALRDALLGWLGAPATADAELQKRVDPVEQGKVRTALQLLRRLYKINQNTKGRNDSMKSGSEEDTDEWRNIAMALNDILGELRIGGSAKTTRTGCGCTARSSPTSMWVNHCQPSPEHLPPPTRYPAAQGRTPNPCHLRWNTTTRRNGAVRRRGAAPSCSRTPRTSRRA